MTRILIALAALSLLAIPAWANRSCSTTCNQNTGYCYTSCYDY